jgi:signal peptidase I
LVKRVIGLPGDHVVCCNAKGRLVINGQPVNETGVIADSSQGADDRPFNVTVPANSIFVLGDNRYVSGDSSRHPQGQSAFVPTSLVTGRAVAVVWPLGDFKLLHTPAAYDDVPPGGTPPRRGTFTESSTLR